MPQGNLCGRTTRISRRTKNNAKAGLSRNSAAGPRPGTLIPGRVMERLWGPFHRASATPRGECRNRVVFETYPLAAKVGVAMALPKRAASARTACRRSTRPATPGPRPGTPPSRGGRRGECHRRLAVVGRLSDMTRKRSPRPRATKGGPGGDGGAVLRGCCSWTRLLGGRCQSGHRAYRGTDHRTSPALTVALYSVRLLREGQLVTFRETTH